MKAARATEGMTCGNHDRDVAIARCSACGFRMCNACFRFTMGDRPSCARCAYETATRPQRRVSLAVFFLAFAAGIAFWAHLRYALDAVSLGAIGILAIVIAGGLLASARDPRRPSVAGRDPEEEVPEGAADATPNPYRAGARRALLAVSPKISGRSTALAVLASLGAAAVLVPASVRWPRWVEAEVVLAAWWAILAGTITLLLYRGFRLKDDAVYFMPWDRPKAPAKSKAGAGGKSGATSSSTSGCSDLGGCSADPGCGDLGGDGEGLVLVIAVVAVLGLAIGAAWFFVEIALPLAAFLMYALLMRAVRFASRDRQGCEGNLARSVARGAAFATLYLLPLVLLTWAIHATGL